MALGTDGVQQVGFGGGQGIDPLRALLWSGSADSVVNLHPPGFASTRATDVAHGQQVGFSSDGRALLWHGTAESVVDLGLGNCWGTNGSIQVGESTISGNDHAVAWFGSAASRIDLHTLLPPNFRSSVASAVADDGSIYGYAYDTDDRYHVIAWVVPQPATGWCATVLSLLSTMAVSRRMR